MTTHAKASHAKLSPSSAHRWLNCPASVHLEADEANTSSEYAAEGTAAHYLAEQCLNKNLTTEDYKGFTCLVMTNGECQLLESTKIVTCQKDEYAFLVTEEMVKFVQGYLDRVTALRDTLGGEFFIEQKLPISHLTGEPRAKGTVDVVIVTATEIVICDLKYGQGLTVEAEQNEQLMMYALAALEEFAFLGEFENVRLIIDQPRKNHISEWSISVEELESFKHKITKAVFEVHNLPEKAQPSAKTCQWCKAKASCNALAEAVHAEVSQDFSDLTQTATDNLAEKYAKLALVKAWADAVQSESYKRMMQGETLQGYKLVQGRKGSRKWLDTAEAEATLKKMRVKHDDMYEKKLISPTTAEKLANKGVIGKRQYPQIQALVTQAEGKPVIAPLTDKRPPLNLNPTSDFDDLTAA